jgi:hypothetical protein
MRPGSAIALLVSLVSLAPVALDAQPFKFAQPDEPARAEDAARRERIAEHLSTPCRADLKGKKIMVVIGEQQANGTIAGAQQKYRPHFQAINTRLRSLGLRTYSAEEIRRQIAQAELEANLRNDPEAARSAAKRLGASFVLRGMISSQAVRNPVMPVNQVTVNMGFTLTGSDGRIISGVEAGGSSYAGADVAGMALTLVNEQADEVVAKLYADYCRNAGPGAGGKALPR